MNKNWVRQADDAIKPLDQVEDARKPSPAQPTALPEAPEAIPMNELLKAFEQAAKELMNAALGIHKASVAMKKITASSGRTPAEMALISKAEGLIAQIEDMHTEAQRVADAVASERTKLLSPSDSKAGWTI